MIRELKKHKFHQKPYFNKNIDINKIVVSKVLFDKKDFKYSTGSKDAQKTKPLMFFPKISAYRRCFDETKYLIKCDELLEKYNETQQ